MVSGDQILRQPMCASGRSLGRWCSSAVLGYIEEALAELLPGAQRRIAETTEEWDAPLPALEERVAKAEKDLRSLRRKLPRLERRAQQAEDEVELQRLAVPPPPSRRWLVAEGGKLHREAPSAQLLPAYMWRCGCGWDFGLSLNYDFVTVEQAQEHSGSFCGGGCDLSDVR